MKRINQNKPLARLAGAALALLMIAGSFCSCVTDGKDGLSAYEIAVRNGATTAKSEAEWLASLRGRDGTDGRSAFELACEAGFDGTIEQWLVSLKGTDGADGAAGRAGKSAYEVAVANGYSGTESQWVADLLGGRGDSGTGGGVGISSVYVNAEKHLIVRLTNGTSVDAGYVGVSTGGSGGTGGQQTGTIDSEGYMVVNQTVVVIAGALNIRSSPDSSADSNKVAQVEQGTELHRVGIGTGNITWSKVMYGGKVCYASSKYLEVKSGTPGDVDLTGIEIPKVNLLDTYTLLVGKQMSFFTDQFVVGLASDMYVSFAYKGSGAKVVRAGSISVTPTAAETAELTFEIRKYISGSLAVLYSKTVKLVSVNPSALSLTGLIIGDSRISDGTLVDTLRAAFGSSLKLIGTLKTGSGNAHEGRGAWSAANYAVYSKTSNSSNPFYNPAKSRFDFEYYLASNNFTAPDFVVFNLGANDNYSALSVIYLGDMIDSIISYSSARSKTIKILIMTEYLSPDDGYCVSHTADSAQLRELQFEYFNRTNNSFGNRTSEGIYIIPNYIVVDNKYDRPSAEIAVSDRSDAKESAVTDIIHLSASGYKKEADVLGAYIYSIFAES